MTNFTGGRVSLVDEMSREKVGDTVILAHDRQSQTIRIPPTAFTKPHKDKLLLTIVLNGAVFQYQGILRRSYDMSKAEIALFRGKRKEDRAMKRYEINLPAKVIRGISDPVEVTLLNISRSGALVKAPDGLLAQGEDFRLIIDIGGKPTALLTKVVRTIPGNRGVGQYGCQFVALLSSEQERKGSPL